MEYNLGMSKSIMGRPPIYETPEEMQAAIDEFFASDQKKGVCRLALHLGFTSRQTLYNYRSKPDYMDMINTALTRVEAEYEDKLDGTGVAGIIFALKNMGWSDKQEINTTIQGGEDPIKIKWQK